MIGSGLIGELKLCEQLRLHQLAFLHRGKTDTGDLLGAGFIISSDGKIATNLHVIEGLRRGGVELASGEKYDSFSVLTFDPRKDIAVIKIPGFDLVTLLDRRKPKPNQRPRKTLGFQTPASKLHASVASTV